MTPIQTPYLQNAPRKLFGRLCLRILKICRFKGPYPLISPPQFPCSRKVLPTEEWVDLGVILFCFDIPCFIPHFLSLRIPAHAHAFSRRDFFKVEISNFTMETKSKLILSELDLTIEVSKA